MAKHSLLVGTISWIDYVRITDMNGSPITGLVYTSTGLASKYVLAQAASVAITLATQTVTGNYSSGGFVEVDATAFPGLYRFDIPNAALASGNKSYVSLYGYSGMNVTMCEYDLVAYNPQDAVRLGLTALPNAAAEAAGGLYTRGVGTGQINQANAGQIDANTVRWLGTAASTPTVAGVPNVNVKTWNDLATVALPLVPATAGRSLVVDGLGLADANVVKVGPTGTGTAQTARDLGTSVLLSSGTGTGQLDFTSGVVKANAVQLLGTAWLTPGVAGTPDVNAKLIGGTSQTARDIGASVLLSSGSGTGQISLSSGAVSLTAGQLAIKKNTALANFEFPMTDSTTNAPKTGLTVTATRSIDGGAFAACANAVSAVSNGIYKISLDATDLNGTVITLRFTAALANDRLITIITQA